MSEASLAMEIFFWWSVGHFKRLNRGFIFLATVHGVAFNGDCHSGLLGVPRAPSLSPLNTK